MKSKIVIAGGTGFIGKYLLKKYQDAGHEVIIISRRKTHIQWHETARIGKALENASLLINLAGKSVDCRYNQKNKQEILASRTETTKILGEAVTKCSAPPELWINASTATIYRHAEDRPMTESEGETGTGFSVEVAKKWEGAFFAFEVAKTRQIALRMAIVLGRGGVMKPLTNLVRFGLGGKQGAGNQMFSWIHIDDLFNIIAFLQKHKNMEGVVNCSAPNPVDNKTLMKTLRKQMNVAVGLPAPAWLLETGAVFIRTETELVLKSRWVLPERLLKEGYDFKFATLDAALSDLLQKKNAG